MPCGELSLALLERAGVVAAPDTLEQDVRAALTKVELGEVDVALVYRTDVTSAGDAVEGVEVPGAEDLTTDYLVTRLADAPNPVAATAFVDHLLSDDGRQVLDRAGFDTP